MANSKSALKRARQNETKRTNNKRDRSHIRTFTTKFNKAVEEGNKTEAEVAYKQISSILDRSAKKNVIPKERASRKKGRLAKRLHAIG